MLQGSVIMSAPVSILRKVSAGSVHKMRPAAQGGVERDVKH
jgi:hypothetical protein